MIAVCGTGFSRKVLIGAWRAQRFRFRLQRLK
jgi:hypothetical protein